MRLRRTRNPRDGEICAVNVDGSDLRNLTGTLGGDSPSWSPDARTIAFDTYVPKTRCSARTCLPEPRPYIYLMNADGSAQRRLVEQSNSDGSFAWSPDVQTIAVVSKRDGNREI